MVSQKLGISLLWAIHSIESIPERGEAFFIDFEWVD